MSDPQDNSTRSVFTEDELDDISQARTLRKNIISAIAEKPSNLSDPEMATLLLKAADGLDRAALGGAKVRVSAKSANDPKSQMAAIMATMIASGLMPKSADLADKSKPNTFVITDKKAGEDTVGRVQLSLEDISHVRSLPTDD
jgi:hypothetical protein